MANKTIKIEAEMSPKVSPKMEKMMKTYAELGAKAANPKDLAKYNKEMDKTIKYAEKWVKLTKEQTKAMKDGPTKALKEQDQLLQQIGKRMETAQMRMGKADEAGREWMYRKLASTGITAQSDPAGYARLSQTAGQITANVRNRAQGDVDVGMDIFRQQREKMDDEKQQQRMERVAKIMAWGAAGKVAGAAVSTAGDVFFGQSMRKAQFGAEAAGFAGKMYGDLTSGDYTGIQAMMKDPAALAQFKEIVSDSKTRSLMTQGGNALSAAGGVVMGAGQTALGIGMMASGAGAGMGGLNLAQGVGSMTGAIGDLGMVAQNYRAGKTEADVSNAAIQGAEYLSRLDPIKLLQMQRLQGRVRQISEYGLLNGQGATTDPASMMADVGAFGIAGGIGSVDESIQYQQALRGVTTTGASLNAAMLGNVMRAPEVLGIGRESAIAGMGATSRMSGGTLGANAELFNVMRKAMALGIDDSKLREAIVTTLPRLLETGSGREGSLGNVMDAMNVAAQSAMNRGQPMDLRDVELGVAANKIGGVFTGGASGIQSLDVAMMGAGINAGHALRKDKRFKNLDANTIQQLSAMGNDKLNKNERTDDMLNAVGIKDDKDKEEVLNAIRTARGKRFESYAKGSGMTSPTLTGALADQLKLPYDQAKAAVGLVTAGNYATQNRAPPPAAVDANGNPIPVTNLTPEQQKAADAARQDAANRQSPDQAALRSKDNKEQLANSLVAAGSFIERLESLSRSGNLEGLKNVPDLIDQVAKSINGLGTAATQSGLAVPGRPTGSK